MLLEQQGYEVTQATVSRDIKELGLLKIPLKGGNGGTFKYVEPTDGPAFSSRLHRVVSEVVIQARSSLNQIVLRTHPGTAMMLAAAIDNAGWPEVLGTIGGDDTVLVICEKPGDHADDQAALRRHARRDSSLREDRPGVFRRARHVGAAQAVRRRRTPGRRDDANLGESDLVAGEGSQDALDAVRRKALALGAAEAVLIDARERFIDDYAYKALAANALYEGVYPLSAALSRPLIADLLVETARRVRRRCGRARLHRQGQRSGAHRGRRARAGAAPARRSRRCATSRSRAPTRSPTRKPTACRSRTPPRSRTRSTPTCGAVRSKPACSKIPGTRRPRTPTRGASHRRRPRSTATRSSSRFGTASRRSTGRRAPQMVFELNKIAGANGVGRID